ncbi:MAG: ATP-binding cassette domain-containing protein [Sphingobacteriia bacterium]|jgi:cell division transport system ATP-binding protein|nr:ATP-binding cassette domain-containing protein [Paludibacteraceae bacterium]NCA80194.1 ATP-binding cassette domain-containing protein [Sphingobacteriia bacterium]
MKKLITYHQVDIQQQELVVLRDVDFELGQGEFVYLLGKVGSGKSSLLKSLYAEVTIKKGEAKIFDYDLRTIKRKDIPFLRRKIGIVFQDFQLLGDRTVQENLEFVLRATGWKDKKKIAEQINLVLSNVGMAKKGYKRPHQLSGGEQQRVVIARALLNSPELVVADEPTGNLDPQTGREIVELLHEICRGGTSVIMATHNHTFFDSFPGRVVSCFDQKLVEGLAEITK